MQALKPVIRAQYLRAHSGQLPNVKFAHWHERVLCFFVPDSIADDGAILFRLVRDVNIGKQHFRRPRPDEGELAAALKVD